MSESGSEHQWDDRRIEAALRALERRVAVLETRFGLEETKPASKAGATAPANHSIESTEPGTPVQFGLELQIGEFALPWVGSAVFLLGIAFLMAYVSNLGYPSPVVRWATPPPAGSSCCPFCGNRSCLTWDASC